MSPSPPFPYFRRLAERDQKVLRQVARWRWAATIGSGLAAPAAHRAHEKWCARPENVHAPSHREIVLILESDGEAYYSLQRRVYRRQTGLVLLFDHHEARDWKGAPHHRGHHTSLWLHFPVASKDSLTYNTVTVTKDRRTSREISHRVYSGDAARLIPNAWDQCKRYPDDPIHWELLKAHVTSLLLEILNTAQAARQPNHQGQVIAYICRYIEEHYADDLALRSLSDIAGYSPYFFHRIFRRQTGMTPKAYIDHLRLARARELLKAGQTVSAVSEAVGIESPFTFSRFFKKHMHYSPAEWRELN